MPNLGIGGGIPFMEMLGRRYPQAQFVVTGALGGDSNMHVPDEWLHIPFAVQVTEAVAHLLDAHARAWRACLTRKGGEPAEGAGAGLQRSSAQGVGPRVFAGFG